MVKEQEQPTSPERRKLERAIEDWKTILREEPDNEWALGELKKLYGQSGRWNALADLLRQEIARIPDAAASKKVAVLQQLIEISRDHLDADAIVLAQHYRAVLALEPGNGTALLALVEACEKNRSWKELVDLLVSYAGLSADPGETIASLRRAAALAIERLGNLGRAASILEDLLAVDPGNAEAAETLAEVHKRRRDWPALLRLWEDGLGGLEGGRRRARLIEMAGLCAEKLADLVRADQLWRLVLEDDPSSIDAAAARERIAERLGDWEGLCRLLEARLGQVDDQSERVALLARVGGIYKDKLSDGARAAGAWRRVLEVKPGHTRALRSCKEAYVAARDWAALERLHLEANDACGLVDLFSAAAEGGDAPEARKALLFRCAEICVDALGRPDDAAPFYERVLSVDSRDERSARALIPYYRSRKQWNRLLAMLVVLLERGHGSEIAEEDAEALIELQGAAQRAGQWQALAEILECRRTRADTDAKEWRSLTLQIVPLAIDDQAARARVVPMLGDVLARFPGDRQAISFLEPLLYDAVWKIPVARLLYPNLSRSAKWQLEVKVLSLVIESSMVAEECLALQKRLADVLLKKARDPLAAFDVLAAALREHAADKDLWDRMTDVAAIIGSFDDLARRLGDACDGWQIDEPIRAELASRLAQVLETQARFEDAVEYHLKVLQIRPENTASLQSLEKFYLADERWDDLLKLYGELLRRDLGDATRLDILFRICVVVDEILHRVPEAIEAYDAVLGFDPGNERAARSLAGLYDESGQWERLYALLCAQVETMRAEESAAACLRLADLAERRLDRAASALEWYERILALDPACAQAREGVERLLENRDTRHRAARALEPVYARGQADAPLEEVLVIQLESAELPAGERIAALMRLAFLREQRLGDPNGAFAALSEAFALNPADQRIQVEVARVAAVGGSKERYARLLDATADSFRGDAAVAGRLLAEAVRLYGEELGDPALAEAAGRRLLGVGAAKATALLPALPVLERVFAARECWLELVQVLRIKAGVEEDLGAQKEALHAMARIEESKLGRAAETIAALKEILRLDKTDERALAGLERLLEDAGKWIELIDVLRLRATAEASPTVKKELLGRIATVASRLKTGPSRRF